MDARDRTGAAADRATPPERAGAAALAALCLGLLAVGASVEPAPAGHGTHERLGLPPCGFAALSGYPCPTCGMTTAVSRLAHADPVGAAVASPAGLLIGLGASALFWVAGHTAVTGSKLLHAAGTMLTPRTAWIAGAIIGASWAYKAAVWPR